MARNFNGTTDYILTTLGAVGAFGSGTVAAILRKTSDSSTFKAPFAVGDADGNQWFPYFDNGASGKLGYYNGTTDATNITGFLTSTEGWALVLLDKTTGTNTIRAHKYVDGVGWTHTDLSAIADSTTPSNTVSFGGQRDFAGVLNGPFPGDIEIVGYKNSRLFANDAAVVAGNLTSPTAWGSLFTTALWRFNQAAVTDSVTDLSGNGATQSGRSGTTVTTGPTWFTDTASAIVSPLQLTSAMSYAAHRAASI